MGSNAPNDMELVTETLAGDREAFGQLYDRHAGRVRAVVAAVSGDWSAVEDMAQESFLRAYRTLARLRDAEQFGPWLLGIARHVARERRRSLRRDRHEFGELEAAETAKPSAFEATQLGQEQLATVKRRVTQLPERERLAIHLYFFDEQRAEQAADVLGMSRSGFYALVRRAVARLATPIKHPNPKEKSTR
jgi:RNA polymerase sigma-70 factor (ECF subfamily)